MKKKIKKVRNNGWEKLKFIEQNLKNKKNILGLTFIHHAQF